MYLQRGHGWCYMKLLPARRCLYHHTTAVVHHRTTHHVASCKATYAGVHACLAVTCHLHFWQNDRDVLRATAVTRGWSRYRNKEERCRDKTKEGCVEKTNEGCEKKMERCSERTKEGC